MIHPRAGVTDGSDTHGNFPPTDMMQWSSTEEPPFVQPTRLSPIQHLKSPSLAAPLESEQHPVANPDDAEVKQGAKHVPLLEFKARSSIKPEHELMELARRVARKQDAVLQSSVMMEQYVREAEQALKDLLPAITRHTGVSFQQWSSKDDDEELDYQSEKVRLEPAIATTMPNNEAARLDRKPTTLRNASAGELPQGKTASLLAMDLRIAKGSSMSSLKSDAEGRIDPQFYSREQMKTILRLQARLGLIRSTGHITATDVLHAVRSLGLEKIALYEIDLLLRLMKEEADLQRSGPNNDHETNSIIAKRLSKLRMRRYMSQNTMSPFGQNRASLDEDVEEEVRVLFKDFVDLIFTVEVWSSKYGPEVERSAMTVREVLFSGDANRLVAELTQVRVDDLAAPRPPYDVSSVVEVFLGIVILVNGIFIGIQANQYSQYSRGWFYIDLCFSLFFFGEITLRCFLAGPKAFLFGFDAGWNMFDLVIVLLALLDIGIHAYDLLVLDRLEAGASSFTILRLVRLTRLTRLFRIFRLRYMKELNIMVKGLLAGLKTLLWAFVLLIFTIYLVAVFTTSLYGESAARDGIVDEEIFSTVPYSMFTAFRCFVGDCTTSEGNPIPFLMAQHYGVTYVIGHVIAIMFVTFGIFNLIIAVYIEQTIEAAKRNQDASRRHRQRESLRIAYLTKGLLKKFCAAHRVCEKLFMVDNQEDIRRILSNCEADDVEDKGMAITREMFLTVIQDPEVQRLMDDLDIPPDRANLFDILDADGSGVLEVTELIQGLLRVRGEAKKSDVVAAVLGVRAIQEMLRQLAETVVSNQQNMISFLAPDAVQPCDTSHSYTPTRVLGSARQMEELSRFISNRQVAGTGSHSHRASGGSSPQRSPTHGRASQSS